jgi:CPA1 family monovalent cation:H+ antiporter
MSAFDVASILFVFAAVVGVANDRFLRLPRGIALLLAALAAALSMLAIGRLTGATSLAELTEHRLEGARLPHILLDGILALLLFAASIHCDLRGLRQQAIAVFVLATVGVLVATALFTFGIYGVFHLAGVTVPLAWCFVLGAIVAPTDAVAVDGLLKQVSLPEGLRDIITGESLFNDGTAVVVFLAALAIASGETGVIGHGRILADLLVDGFGGAAVGAALGFIAHRAATRVGDDSVALTISIALAFAAYRVATWLDLSGPIAVVVAGLVLVNLPDRRTGKPGWHGRLGIFWSLVDDLVNTLLFVLMGFEILALDLSAFPLAAAVLAIPLALVVRYLSVWLPIAALPLKIAHKRRAVALLAWVGLRGAVSIALVLIVPPGPYHPALSAVCYAIVIFTIVVQGLSTPRMVAALYPPPAAKT